MAKKFIGNVSIHMHRDGARLILKSDKDGAFSNDNADELRETLKAKAKELKVDVCKWAMWEPKGGSVPVLCADRFGKPVLHVLQPKPASEQPGIVKRSTKIA